MNGKTLVQLILYIGIFLTIESCGGGFSKDDKNDPISNSNALNPELEGEFLWSSDDGNNKKLEILSGRWSEISVIQNWIEQNQDMNNIDDLYESFSRFTNDGKFALKIIHDCDSDVGGVLNDILAQCVVVFDLTKQSIISEFTLSPIVSRSLKSIALSDDGQHIGILDTANRDYYRLRIYDIEGNEIDESYYADRQVGEFVKVESLEWLPNGHLIFSYGPAVMLSTEPYSTSARVIKVFPKNEGEPIHLRVSPDGSKIAFALKTDSTFVSLDSTLWVMDADGSNPYQLVEALGSTQPEMNSPAWSQDGNWIAFEFGGLRGLSSTSPGLPSGLLVVPSDSVKAIVSYDESKISSEIFRISSFYTPGRDDWETVEDPKLRKSFPGGRVTWVMP